MPTTPLSNDQQQPGHNRAKSWLLISLGLFAVLVLIVALLVFRKMHREGDAMKAEDAAMITGGAGEDANKPTKPTESSPMHVLAGRVSEIISAQDDSGQKWIKLSVSLPKDIPSASPGSEQKTSKSRSAVANADASTNTLQYQFFLAKDTIGVDDISGGEFVAVSFVRDPSTEEYVDAEKIEVLDNRALDSNQN